MKKLGIYIHIPFCKSFCPYCDFYKVKADEELMQKYTEAVMKTTASFSHEKIVDDYVVDSIYFGGGTPSALDGSQLSNMLEEVRNTFSVSEDAEITVECNPLSASDSFLGTIANAGVNRISLGLQSASSPERRALGRSSDREIVRTVIKKARNYGLENISLDIMLGVPNQSESTLLDTLNFCIDESIPHISGYMLKLEPGTVFEKRRDSLCLPCEDDVCTFYNLTCDVLDSVGLQQYEISNFARPGFESRHNLKYWNCEEYLGIGPAAHSFLNGKRFYYPRDVQSFIDGLLKPVDDGVGGTYEERLMLALRTTRGFPISELKPETKKLAQAVELQPYVSLSDGFMRLTRSGFLISNYIISRLI